MRLSEPTVVHAGPYHVAGCYATFEGDDEGPAWSAAYTGFLRCRDTITNRVGDTILGFLYRPRRDHPDAGADVRACFVGVEVSDIAAVPADVATTRFSEGQYVTVTSTGDTEEEAAMGVGDAVTMLERWASEHGYVEGDACFAMSYENEPKPPFVEHVWMKIEPAGD